MDRRYAAHLTYSEPYVNGFQTQPEEAGRWRDHDDLLLHDAAGDRVTDPDRPPLMILRDRDLVVPGATDYLFERC